MDLWEAIRSGSLENLKTSMKRPISRQELMAQNAKNSAGLLMLAAEIGQTFMLEYLADTIKKRVSRPFVYSMCTVSSGVLIHNLDSLSRLDCSATKRVPMPKSAVFERSRGELFLDVSVGVHNLLVVEQSSLKKSV